MARADLLIELVKSAVSGDKKMFRRVTESIIAEERSKQHIQLADKLQQELNALVERNALDLPSAGNVPIAPNEVENYLIELKPTKRIEELILPHQVIKLCKELVEEHYRADLLRSFGLEPRNKVLMTGAPGTGKTSLAEVLANELMLPIYVIRYDSLVGSYLGETALRMRRLFDFIRSRKCIVFFDEFDTLGKERGDLHETGEIKRVVSSLLLQIDALPSYNIILCATNHPELLDRAVWRRFQIKWEMPLPTRDNICRWVKLFETQYNISFDLSAETIAKRLLGYSYAEIEEFGLSVMRRHILASPHSNMRTISLETLKDFPVHKNSKPYGYTNLYPTSTST